MNEVRKAAKEDCKPLGERGFSLIELMISLTVMAFILGGLAMGLRTIAKGWDRHSGRIADQEGVGEMRKEIGIPHVIDVMRKILDEDRPPLGARLDILPNAFKGQTGRGLFALAKAGPREFIANRW